jgi:hypothetical protein
VGGRCTVYIFLCHFGTAALIERGDQTNRNKKDGGGMSYFLAPAANAYCSLCFMIFLVLLVMFLQTTVASESVNALVVAPRCVQNGTSYLQSDRSDTVQMVFGNSYAASDTEASITTQSVSGSVSFALIWAFISVMLFVSCYAAYSSTTEGEYCPLFLSSR